jgi:NhaA family Na+:H+ antiporter
MELPKKTPIEKLIYPLQGFIKNEKSAGIALGISVLLAIIIANSPFSELYHHIFEHKFGFQFDGKSYLTYSLHHWINDGLMAIFFFVVGLELKNEFINGELANPKQALLPIVAALGGMLVPAIIYFSFNPSGEAQAGWGIPMATDIAFALGVLYLLGNRIPIALKVFLAALAIVDDLGAVLVIAFFYTSEISSYNLLLGFVFVLIMYLGNRLGIRSVLFYALVGILGVWTSFLLSGVHATIAAVIAAFMIPADVKLKESLYIHKITSYLERLQQLDPKDKIPTLTSHQMEIIDKINKKSYEAVSPSKHLIHSLHAVVSFVILPIFAFANSGISLNFDLEQILSPVTLGVGFGLLFGKVIGIVGFTYLLVKLKVSNFPNGMNLKNLFGLGFLGSIGFTMSLFVTSLAFSHEELMLQAKLGIFIASILGGIIGYQILKNNNKK